MSERIYRISYPLGNWRHVDQLVVTSASNGLNKGQRIELCTSSDVVKLDVQQVAGLHRALGLWLEEREAEWGKINREP